MDPIYDDYNEENAGIWILKKLVDWNAISQQQKYIAFLICGKVLTQRDVIQIFKTKFGIKLSFEALQHCIVRTAYSVFWEKGMSGGALPYLCNEDLKSLATEIRERALASRAFDTKSIREEAANLKKLRIAKALQVLEYYRCKNLKDNLAADSDFELPSRQWVNNIIDKVNAKLQDPIIVDGARYYDCTEMIMEEYKVKVKSLIEEQNSCNELIFTADETSIDTKFKRKKIVPLTLRYFIETQPELLPHVTALCCNNLVGVHPPLFVILKDRKTMPPELISLAATGQIWLVSTTSGWMDRWAWMIWMIHIIPWIMDFKSHMGPFFERNNPILIMDGHSSRTVPLALELAKQYNIKLFILPSHTSHVSQLFDVTLASPLKRAFTDLLYSMLNDTSNHVVDSQGRKIHAATLRKCEIEAFVQAWNTTCTMTNCMSGASETSLIGDKSFIDHKFCRKETAEDIENRHQREAEKASHNLYINNGEITEKIPRFKEALNAGPFAALCRELSTFENEDELVSYVILEARKHGCYLLGSNFRWGNVNYISKLSF